MSKFEVKPLLKKYPLARYYFLIGARNCGKTYPCVGEALEDAIAGRGGFAYVRRYKESITETKIIELMAPQHGRVAELTDGEWNHVGYWRHAWYLEKWEEDEDGNMRRVKRRPVPIGYAFAMNTWETDKGPDYFADKGGVAHIIIDEVFSKGGKYLPDEFGIFENIISSIVRGRWQKGTKVWCLANPVSKYGGQYIRNFGITKEMRENPGTYEIKYPDHTGKITERSMSAIFVYIAAITDKSGNTIEVDEEATNIYNSFFAFKHSKGKAQSITHGFWELDEAPGLPSGVYRDSEKRRSFYVLFDEEVIAIDVMRYNRTGVYYLFLRPASKVPKDAYFLTLDMSLEKRAIIGLKTGHPAADYLNKLYRTNQVYYSDFQTADVWHGFLLEAKKRVA